MINQENPMIIETMDTNMKNQIAMLKTENEVKTKKIVQLQTENQKLQQQYEELLKNLIKYQNEISIISKKNTCLHQKLKIQSEMIKNIQLKMKDQEQFQQDKVEMQKKLQDLTNQVATQFEQNSKQNQIILELKNINQVKEDQIKLKEDELTKHFEKQISMKNQEIEKKKQEISNFKLLCEKKQGEIQQIKHSAKSILKTSKKEIKKLQEQLKKFESCFEKIYAFVLPNETTKDLNLLEHTLEKHFASYKQQYVQKQNTVNEVLFKSPDSNSKNSIQTLTPQKFEKIEAQFQTDLSLEAIIKLHNQLSQEESTQNQKYINV